MPQYKHANVIDQLNPRDSLFDRKTMQLTRRNRSAELWKTTLQHFLVKHLNSMSDNAIRVRITKKLSCSLVLRHVVICFVWFSGKAGMIICPIVWLGLIVSFSFRCLSCAASILVNNCTRMPYAIT